MGLLALYSFFRQSGAFAGSRQTGKFKNFTGRSTRPRCKGLRGLGILGARRRPVAPLFLKIRPLINILLPTFRRIGSTVMRAVIGPSTAPKKRWQTTPVSSRSLCPTARSTSSTISRPEMPATGNSRPCMRPAAPRRSRRPTRTASRPRSTTTPPERTTSAPARAPPISQNASSTRTTEQISSITLLDENGLMVRQVTYTYYATGDNYGLAGDLMLATEEFSSDNGATWSSIPIGRKAELGVEDLQLLETALKTGLPIVTANSALKRQLAGGDPDRRNRYASVRILVPNEDFSSAAGLEKLIP